MKNKILHKNLNVYVYINDTAVVPGWFRMHDGRVLRTMSRRILILKHYKKMAAIQLCFSAKKIRWIEKIKIRHHPPFSFRRTSLSPLELARVRENFRGPD